MYNKEQLHRERIAQSFVQRLENACYGASAPLQAECRVFAPPRPFADRLTGGYTPIRPGDRWGQAWDVAWFHVQGQVPREWHGQAVVARLDIQGEICVYDASGCPCEGLTSTSVYFPNWLHDRHLLLDCAEGGETVDFWFEASATKINGLDLQADPPRLAPARFGTHTATVKELSLKVFATSVRQLFLDTNLLCLQMLALPEGSVRRLRIARALMEADNGYDPTDPNAAAATRQRLAGLLADSASSSDLATVATGHAHLDTAWLWPIEESVRKCARTFSRQVRLLETYPDYVFGASQAQHYAFVKEHYPQLFERIRSKVAEGRWELQGGMWVEADCNVIGGEAMVRQLLHGINFFKREFGQVPRNLWLPDVFGYSAALPQILRGCGIDYLVTQKMCWNMYNRFPHHTFRWQGLDGATVTAHFPPEDTYNSVLNPGRLIHARDNFEERDFLPEFLTLFGLGDGGGGPADDIIEMGLRQRDLEGVPRVRFGKAQDYLDSLEAHREKLAVWVGELYLERHRGTLTTQARVKHRNRALEHRLRAIEILSACGPLEQYPAAKLDSAWKTLLLHQFHDILPGSSVHRVYEDTHAAYDRLDATCAALTTRAGAACLAPRTGAVALINTLSCPYRGTVSLPALPDGQTYVDTDGAALPCQQDGDGVLVQVALPGLSAVTVASGPDERGIAPPDHNDTNADSLTLENALVRYRFDRDGCLQEAYDKELAVDFLSGELRGNLLSLYEDRSELSCDAWDIDVNYVDRVRDTAQVSAPMALRVGPVRQTLHVQFRIGQSRITQDIHLGSGSRRLDFEARVDWRERHRMLRVTMEAAVHAEEATYEIQFGSIRRSTHANTSWDYAKYEVCGHRFVDVSQVDRGIALLNDGKYGHHVRGNVISLNLLRSPTYPDADADLGQHAFTYSLLPHAGDLATSDVVVEARCLNQPPLVFDGREGPSCRMPLGAPDAENVVVETIKRAENDEAALVARLYEAVGAETTVRVPIRGDVASIDEANMIEETGSTLDIRDGAIVLHFRPFEIKTVVLR